MNIEKVSACLLSWKRPKNMQRIVDHLRSHACIDDIIIWNNNPDVILSINDSNTTIINSATNLKTYGRFLAAYHAKHQHIYTQDDDCIVKDIPGLLRLYNEDSSRIAHGLRDDHFDAQEQFDFGKAHVAFLGWGGFFQKEWMSVFDTYIQKHGVDTLLQSKADRIFSLLQQKKHTTMRMPIENLEGSRGPEALWTQPEFYTESHAAEKRALSLIHHDHNEDDALSIPQEGSNKFVIMSMARTGGTFVTEALMQHPELFCLGELYMENSIENAQDLDPREKMTNVEWRDQNPLKYLEYVWKQNHDKGYTGFKFHLSQNDAVRTALTEDATIKKILVYRKNTLRQFVSLRIASTTQEWSSRLETGKKKPRVTIDPQKLRQFSEYQQWLYATTRKTLHQTGQQYIEIAYEDFMQDKERYLQNVCSFLGVQTLSSLCSTLQKQNPEPLHELVDNFEELEKELKGTVYEEMLYGDEYMAPKESKKKFVIMTMPRAGSNFLVEVLGKHPEIRCYGELYNYTSMHSTQSLEPKEHMTDMRWRNAHPLQFMDNIWKQEHGKRYTGFKLFFEQNFLVKERLCENKEVKKIFLRRDNILRQYVSLRIALKNQVWGVRNEQDLKKTSVSIDVIKFIDFAERVQRYFDFARKTMQATNQQYFEITYEELMGDTQNKCIEEVCSFLGVPFTEGLTSGLHKQNPAPLCEIVENFAELEQQLKGTVYESMLYGDEYALARA